MDIKKLLNELDALNLPIDQYAITASGPLAIREIREAKDLDIIVTSQLWNKLSKEYPVRKGRFETINIGNIQVLGAGSHFSNPKIQAPNIQIEEADIINGHRFVKLNTLKTFKQALGREKDIQDVKLINQYASKSGYNSLFTQ